MKPLPHRLEAVLRGVLARSERHPLGDPGLDDRPVAWVRVGTPDALHDVRGRFEALGARCSRHATDRGRFLLARLEGVGRVEVVAETEPDGGVAPFAEAVDRAIRAREAGHSLAYWDATNSAIAALVRFAWEALGGPPSGPLPPLRTRLPLAVREALSQLRAGLNLRDSRADLHRVLDFAVTLAGVLPGPAGDSLIGEAEVLRPTLENGRFWNLRDVAAWWAPPIRPRVLLRGRAPSEYSGDDFWSWAEPTGIRQVVDLRGANERARAPGAASPGVRIRTPRDLLDPRAAGDKGALYEAIAVDPAVLGALIEAVAADEGPVYVHCHAGVDRTGVAVAVLGAWLGVSDEQLLADYEASGQLTDPALLQRALGAARASGFDRLLAGVPSQTLARARARLLA
jgi:hypothetical protein